MKVTLDITVQNNHEEEIVLTREEARELYYALKEIFEKDDPPTPHSPVAPNYPWTDPWRGPRVVPWTAPDTGTPMPDPPYTITCTYSNGNVTS